MSIVNRFNGGGGGEGEAGPAGPKGPKGTDGADGADGTDLLPLDNQWTGLNHFAGGLVSKGFNQGSTRIGLGAGQDNQGMSCVGIGSSAGHLNQGKYSVALGSEAGENDQSDYSVAIGTWAGQESQGINSIAVGFAAGRNNQGAGGLILNANGSAIEDTTNGHVHIASSQASLDYTTAAGEWTVTDASGTHTLIGADGAPGAPGARWFSGNGSPSDSIGATGDYYLDGTSGNVWVRTGSQWLPSGDNLKGPQGPPGTSGKGAEGLTTLPYAAIASDYLVEGLTMGAGDEQNLLCTGVWNFTVGGDLINDGVSFQPIGADSFDPDFNGRVRITSTVVFSTSQVPSGYLVIRNNGVDVSNYEAFYKTHLDLTGTKLSSEIDIVIDVKVGDVIEPFFGVGSGSCVIHQSYTDILRLDFGVAAETVNLSTLKEIVSESTGFKDFQSKIKAL